jgi:hypothetical protein
MTDPASRTWTANPVACSFRTWPGEVVLFSRVGGDTVVLSGLSAALMEQLLRQPQTVDSLVKAVRTNDASAMASDNLPKEIRDLLGDLVRIGAVEPLTANHRSAVAAEGSPTRLPSV